MASWWEQAVKKAKSVLRVEAKPPRDRLFRLMVDGLTDYAIFALDEEGHLISWSPASEKIFGYHASEILGKSFACLYAPDAQKNNQPSQELRIAASHGRFEDLGWRRRKDGRAFWANSILCPLYEEGVMKGFSNVTRELGDIEGSGPVKEKGSGTY